MSTRRSDEPTPTLHHRPPEPGPLYATPKRLVDRISNAREGSPPKRLLLNIIAPVGYGKTSLAAACCRESDRPVVWLTLSDGDYDGDNLARLLRHSADLAGIDLRGSGSLEDAVGGASPLIIAVDNAHLIAAEAASLLKRIYDSLRPGSLLILCSDETHRFPVSRLRMEGELLELKTADLAAADEEAAGLFERLGTGIDPGQLTSVVRRTGGWWACLRLFALSWRETDSRGRDRLLKRLAATDTFIAEFISESIDSSLPARLREFLVRISVTSLVNGELAGELSGLQPPEALSAIRSLADRYLLIPAGHGWYRSSPIMRRYYFAGLPRNEAAGLHAAAARWFESHGMAEEASRHRKRTALPSPESAPSPLQRREKEILTLVAAGLSNAEIGERLFISVGTVKWHMNNILQKLECPNRTAAVETARRRKILG